MLHFTFLKKKTVRNVAFSWSGDESSLLFVHDFIAVDWVGGRGMLCWQFWNHESLTRHFLGFGEDGDFYARSDFRTCPYWWYWDLITVDAIIADSTQCFDTPSHVDTSSHFDTSSNFYSAIKSNFPPQRLCIVNDAFLISYWWNDYFLCTTI